MNTFATLCRQRGWVIDEMEATTKSSLTGVLAHLGLEEGEPSLDRVDITPFITSPAAGALLRGNLGGRRWRRSPLFQTL